MKRLYIRPDKMNLYYQVKYMVHAYENTSKCITRQITNEEKQKYFKGD
jgi:hypothetical protein